MNENLEKIKLILLEFDNLRNKEDELKSKYAEINLECTKRAKQNENIEKEIEELEEQISNKKKSLIENFSLLGITILAMFSGYVGITYGIESCFSDISSQIPFYIGIVGMTGSFIVIPIEKRRIKKLEESDEYKELINYLNNKKIELKKGKDAEYKLTKTSDNILEKLMYVKKQLFDKEEEIRIIHDLFIHSDRNETEYDRPLTRVKAREKEVKN